MNKCKTNAETLSCPPTPQHRQRHKRTLDSCLLQKPSLAPALSISCQLEPPPYGPLNLHFSGISSDGVSPNCSF